MNESARVVRAELERGGQHGGTVFENSGFRERMWEPDYSRPKIGFGGDQ
ncbi:hypothetical protein [Subtercola boreus]|nr:hypothetical protein [Subtercola boreus]